MNRSSSRQSMFLMEMILAVLFFSLVSALCLRIFTSARQMSRDTGRLHMAVNQSQNAAELLQSGISSGSGEALFPENLFLEYPGAEHVRGQAGQEMVTVSYDREWAQCPPQEQDSDAQYRMNITGTEKDGLYHYQISVVEGEDTLLYALELRLHPPLCPPL